MANYTAINNPELYFQCKLYTGNGSADHAITLDGDENMQPDLVWIKNRDATDSHCLFNSVAGVGELTTTDTNAATTTDADTLDAFQSNGFRVDADVKVNTNTEKYVAWCWKETATAGFDIVQFSGNATDRTVAHSLSAIPNFYTYQQATQAAGKVVYHKYNDASGAPDNLTFNDANAASNHPFWHLDTHPTSSVFSVGENADVNVSGTNNIRVLLWAPIQGFSRFGSYHGNGNNDGTFVYTGFKPAFVLQKNISATGSWHIHDNKRSINGTDIYLYPDTNEAEVSTTRMDFLSTGFKLRSDSSAWNNSGNEFIFIAFAESPLVNSNGVCNNAK